MEGKIFVLTEEKPLLKTYSKTLCYDALRFRDKSQPPEAGVLKLRSKEIEAVVGIQSQRKCVNHL